MMDKQAMTVVRSDRRTAALEIDRDGHLVVRIPRHFSDRQLDALLASHERWIDKHLKTVRAEAEAGYPPLTDAECDALKKKAKEILPARVAWFASKMGVDYGRISVRAQKTKWGSCSSEGNLNFNCLLMLTPPDVQDYIVVHELCHRREMNHSARFWAEVSRVLPHYAESKKWLTEHGGMLIRRLPKQEGGS